ncbi:MAG: DUF1569 domain-containing protein [Flavisolibacter sp.]
MKTIFDPNTREELINRIHALNENNTAQWGRMSLYQMLKHCSQWEEMILGKTKYKQSFMGKLFGKSALRNMIKDDRPMKKNLPTLPDFKVRSNGEMEAEKRKWIGLIKEHEHVVNPNFIHPFFGKMTREQVGFLAYKHSDHHLRQFQG